MYPTNAPLIARKTFSLPANTVLTDESLNLLHDMLLNLSPNDMRNSWLELYHSYVQHEHDNLPIYFDEIVAHFYCLDNFFKAIVTAQYNKTTTAAPAGGLHH